MPRQMQWGIAAICERFGVPSFHAWRDAIGGLPAGRGARPSAARCSPWSGTARVPSRWPSSTPSWPTCGVRSPPVASPWRTALRPTASPTTSGSRPRSCSTGSTGSSVGSAASGLGRRRGRRASESEASGTRRPLAPPAAGLQLFGRLVLDAGAAWLGRPAYPSPARCRRRTGRRRSSRCRCRWRSCRPTRSDGARPRRRPGTGWGGVGPGDGGATTTCRRRLEVAAPTTGRGGRGRPGRPRWRRPPWIGSPAGSGSASRGRGRAPGHGLPTGRAAVEPRRREPRTSDGRRGGAVRAHIVRLLKVAEARRASRVAWVCGQPSWVHSSRELVPGRAVRLWTLRGPYEVQTG